MLYPLNHCRPPKFYVSTVSIPLGFLIKKHEFSFSEASVWSPLERHLVDTSKKVEFMPFFSYTKIVIIVLK